MLLSLKVNVLNFLSWANDKNTKKIQCLYILSEPVMRMMILIKYDEKSRSFSNFIIFSSYESFESPVQTGCQLFPFFYSLNFLSCRIMLLHYNIQRYVLSDF